MLFPVGPAERVCCKTGRASVVGLGAEFAWPQDSTLALRVPGFSLSAPTPKDS